MNSSSWRGDALIASLLEFHELEIAPDIDEDGVSRMANDLILDAQPKIDESWRESEEMLDNYLDAISSRVERRDRN